MASSSYADEVSLKSAETKYGTLFEAATNGSLEGMKTLLAAGAKVDATNDRGW